MTTNPSHKITETDSKPSPSIPKKRRGSSWPLIGGVILVVVLGIAIFLGIRSRTQAETELKSSTQNNAKAFVNVIYPKSGSAGDEIKLPGSTQAPTLTRRSTLAPVAISRSGIST